VHACNRTVGQCSYYVAEGALEVISLRDVLDLLIWHLSDLYAAMPIGRMGFDGGLPIEAIRFDLAARAVFSATSAYRGIIGDSYIVIVRHRTT
jgi:hypothetical protein